MQHRSPQQPRLFAAAVAGLLLTGLTTAPAVGTPTGDSTTSMTPTRSTPAALAPAAPQSSAVEMLVYSRRGSLFMLTPGGDGRVELTPGWSGHADDPAISPDGRAIIFRLSQSSWQGLAMIPAAPTAQRDLVRVVPGSAWAPTWSVDGMLAYVALQPDVGPEVYVREQTTAVAVTTQVTQLEGDDYPAYPTWSPDGTRVAYERVTSGCSLLPDLNTILHGHLEAVAADGSGATATLYDPSADTAFRGLDWSSQGILAFAEDRYGERLNDDHCGHFVEGGVRTMPADGSEAPTPLSTGVEPAWSPDGTSVVFGSPVFEDGAWRSRLWTIEADGTDARPLHREGDHADWGALVPLKGTTHISVSVERRKRLRVSGRVVPEVPRQPVSVTLLRRRSGTFIEVRRRTVTLDRSSYYQVAVRSPVSGVCRVVARYAGDALHRASRTRQRVRC